MRFILTLVFDLFLCCNCFAMQQAIVGSVGGTVLATTGTQYDGLFAGSEAAGATETQKNSVCPINTKFSKMYVSLQNNATGAAQSPDNGAGVQSWVFTLRVNETDTALTCTISEAQTSCSDLTDSVNITAGQRVDISITASGTPVATALANYGFLSDSGKNTSMVIGGSNSTTHTTGTQYISVSGQGTSWNATEATRQAIIPTAGTFSNFYVSLETAPDNGVGTQSNTWTIKKNGVATAVTCTISEAAKTCSDTSNSFAVVAGDKIAIDMTVTGTSTTSVGQGWGIKFAPTIDGESIYIVGGNTAPSASAANYTALNDITGWNASYFFRDQLSATQVIYKKLYAAVTTAPDNGVGTQSYAFTLRDDNSNTALTCTISEAATSCNDTSNTVTSAENSLMDILSTPANTPAATGNNYVAVVGYIAPRRTYTAL